MVALSLSMIPKNRLHGIDIRIEKYTSKRVFSNGCILWIGSCGGGDSKWVFPQLTVGIRYAHNHISVPRYLLEKKLDRDIRFGYQANHTCDNIHGPCINVDHIYEGTQQMNMWEMVIRERGHGKEDQYGEKNFMAILTEDQVRTIFFRLWAKKEYGVILAKEYGVSINTISKIRIGKTWSHVTKDIYASLQGACS